MCYFLPRSFSRSAFLCFLLFQVSGMAQNATINIDTAFQKYADTYRENAYIHLNKTKLIKGEDLGFAAYVFHKQTQLLSDYSKNLYCVISDKNDSIIKKKMIQLENGFAHNSFKIDESFSDGFYTFRAYTNWMLNFPNEIFSESFEIIDGANNEVLTKTKRSKSLDIQFLPESGHLLHGVRNTVGIVIKDSLNYGVPNLKGEIRNDKNEVISDFTLNQFGISRFTLIPEKGKNYYASINYQNTELQSKIDQKIDTNGILLKLTEYGKYCVVSLITNEETLAIISGEKLLLTFHDGSVLKKIPIVFTKETSITKKIPLQGLSAGINTFTLFDGQNNPVAERLFFNYSKVKLLKSKVSKVKRKDSIIQLELAYKNFTKKGFNNLSISALPRGTKAYQKNSNIIAQTLLKPFVRGTIENPGYYFQKSTKKIKYDLDNLLITQGWSSYNWDSIFNYRYAKKYLFENGISIKAAIPKKVKDRQFVVHGTSTRKSQMIALDKKDQSFSLENYFPFDQEKLSVSRINRNGNLKMTSLDVEFFPNAVPTISFPKNTLPPKADYYALELFADANWFKTQNKSELLNEIFLTTNLEQRRQEKIKRKYFGNVYFVAEMDERLTLVDFLNKRPGIRAREDYTKGEIEVVNTFQRMSGGQDAYPVFFLNDMEITRDQLFRYYMDNVDYVEVSNFDSGKNMSLKSSMTISIYTKDGKNARPRKPTVSKFKFPLTFSSPKEFYRPKYQKYKGAFFREYGVIDWLPKNTLDEKGKTQISIIYKQNQNFTLFIEGVTSEGEFIFEEKEINFK